MRRKVRDLNIINLQIYQRIKNYFYWGLKTNYISIIKLVMSDNINLQKKKMCILHVAYGFRCIFARRARICSITSQFSENRYHSSKFFIFLNGDGKLHWSTKEKKCVLYMSHKVFLFIFARWAWICYQYCYITFQSSQNRYHSSKFFIFLKNFSDFLKTEG